MPEEAIVPEGLEQYVFVVQDGVVDKRSVLLGRRIGLVLLGLLGGLGELLLALGEVLDLLAHRLSNQEIAERLFISPVTVKRHTSNIYRKLDVNRRRDAVVRAHALGLLRKS